MTNKFLMIVFFILLQMNYYSCIISRLKFKNFSRNFYKDENSIDVNNLVKGTLQGISDNSVLSTTKQIYCSDNKKDIKDVISSIKNYDYPQAKFILQQIYNKIDDESISKEVSKRLVCAGVQTYEKMTETQQSYWKNKFQFDRLPYKSDKYYFWIGIYFKKVCTDGQTKEIFISSTTDEDDTIKIAASGNLIKCLYGESHPIIKYTTTYYVGFSQKKNFVKDATIFYPRSKTNLFYKQTVTVDGQLVIGNDMEKKVFNGKYMDSVVINGVFRLIVQFKSSFSLSSSICYSIAKLEGNLFDDYLKDVDEALLYGIGSIKIKGDTVTKGMIKDYKFNFSRANIYYRRLDGNYVPSGLYFRITSYLMDEAKTIANDILEAYMPAFKKITPLFESIDVKKISSKNDIDSDSAVYVTKEYLGIKIIQNNLDLGLECTFKVDKFEGYCALTAKGLKSPIGIYINVFSKTIDKAVKDFMIIGEAAFKNDVIQIDDDPVKFLGGFELGSFSSIESVLTKALTCDEKKKFGNENKSLLKEIFPKDDFLINLWNNIADSIFVSLPNSIFVSVTMKGK